jgi:hypothetical protein
VTYFTDVEKAKCALQFEQNYSEALLQGLFHMNYGNVAPTRKSIYKWQISFAETGCICATRKNSGRRPTDETVERVRAVVSPQFSGIHKAAKQGIELCLSHECGGCYVNDCLSGDINSTAAGVKDQ